MTTLEALLRAHDRLTPVHVERWVARGLLRPSADGENWIFEPVDVARVGLLADLTEQMGFDEESVETVVDLLDQVHTLRRQLSEEMGARHVDRLEDPGVIVGRRPQQAACDPALDMDDGETVMRPQQFFERRHVNCSIDLRGS